VLFTGGGIFFWWQAGWVSARPGVEQARMVGMSAGALTAVLAKCGVGVEESLRVALEICDRYGVFRRPLGLLGCWGAIIRDWLDAVLPADAHVRCAGEVTIVVTAWEPFRWPPLRRLCVADFGDRAELIDACMASAHIPWFINGRFFATFRGRRCLDGSL
ncbi:hypothetical protein M885DRAFT_414770, partial [Pelagophyceae sp. CCMP2097]